MVLLGIAGRIGTLPDRHRSVLGAFASRKHHPLASAPLRRGFALAMVG